MIDGQKVYKIDASSTILFLMDLYTCIQLLRCITPNNISPNNELMHTTVYKLWIPLQEPRVLEAEKYPPQKDHL